MEPYHHILVATDLSDESDAAVMRALDLAQRYGSRLTLLHVVDYTVDELPIDWLETGEDNSDDFLRNRAEQALTELAAELGRDRTQTAVIMNVKSPVREILEYSNNHEVDLVVLAAHGRQGLSTWLKSASTSVFQQSRCDVMAIRI
jgi:universal stress protein A